MLWNKPVAEISVADVDDFLHARIAEGHRLDYKLTFPDDLAKTIAAFANTLGGLIILGVDAHRSTNEPIWPPKEGMPVTPGIADRIVQIATGAIYPPVRIGVATVDNPHLTGCQIAIVRVDESREAPHAVDKRRKVYVYERGENRNDPIALADIDRIRHLLDRRDAIESRREALIDEGLAKLRRELEGGLSPKGWVTVAPIYPWRDLCRPSECLRSLQEMAEIGLPRNTARDVQRVPDGALMRIRSRFADDRWLPTDAAWIRTEGACIYMRTILSLDRRQGYGVSLVEFERSDKLFEMPTFWKRIEEMFDHARGFLSRPAVERAGLLSLGLGLEGIAGFRLSQREGSSHPYLEDEYRDAAIVPADEFLESNDSLEILKNRFIFGFDLATPEGF